MDAYCEEIRKLEGKFYGLEFNHVLRDFNKVADALAKMGSTLERVLPGVFVQDLVRPFVKQNPNGTMVEPTLEEVAALASLVAYEASDWRKELGNYLTHETVPP
ncbi:unnamed protein product [Urochloa humidicola]